MSLLQDTQQLRRRMPHVWAAFFARYGSLTPAQLQAMPSALDGKNVMISAPTATGKTEAIVAPVAQQLCSERWSGLAVLFVVPTRALANDMYQRLEPPLREVGVAVALKHGDKPALPRVLPSWLITTPESLDSMLGRVPAAFVSLRVVIIDEIHLLDGTPRGDQLRILLRRLQCATSCGRLHIHLLSATLRAPAETAARYVDECEVIVVEGGRSINQYYVSDLHGVVQLARRQRWGKLLVFCNMRQAVEETAAALSTLWHPHPVVAHHGSLERQRREEAEKVMRECSTAICVATSTLEIGIDIGSIDAVVLAQPPFSVASLMQRIGRGNRRTREIQAIAVTKTDDERALLEQMFASAAVGDYQSRDYAPERSVVVQQIVSVLFQKAQGISRLELDDLLMPLEQRTAIDLIIGHLHAQGWLEMQRSLLYPSTRLLDEALKGTIHSNIPDDGDVSVIDVASERIIGRISRPFDSVFLLSGQSWRVVKTTQRGVMVTRIAGGGVAAQITVGRSKGRWYGLLPPTLR